MQQRIVRARRIWALGSRQRYAQRRVLGFACGRGDDVVGEDPVEARGVHVGEAGDEACGEGPGECLVAVKR